MKSHFLESSLRLILCLGGVWLSLSFGFIPFHFVVIPFHCVFIPFRGCYIPLHSLYKLLQLLFIPLHPIIPSKTPPNGVRGG